MECHGHLTACMSDFYRGIRIYTEWWAEFLCFSRGKTRCYDPAAVPLLDWSGLATTQKKTSFDQTKKRGWLESGFFSCLGVRELL